MYVAGQVGTYGGTGEGAACVFPHTYRGQTYNQCHPGVFTKRLWCCIVPQCGQWFAKKWGYCKQQQGDHPIYTG